MTPRRVVQEARKRGIDIIAVTDHNSAENVNVAVKAGVEEGVTVIPAMEITSQEEAHVLALFESVDMVLLMQELVYLSLTEGQCDEKEWQLVVNLQDEVMEFSRRLLMGASGLPLGGLVNAIHERGGLAVACHVDKPVFSVISQLGFVPENLKFDAFEVIDPAAAEPGLWFHPDVPRIKSSDAHHVVDIGRRTTSFELKAPTFKEMALALKGKRGRSVLFAGA